MIAQILQTLAVLPLLAGANPVEKRSTPPPGACSGSCQGDHHDPSVVYNGKGTYYRFVTDNKIQIATSNSISGPWTDRGSAIPAGSSINLPGRDVLWAPDVFLHDGTYYMYYSVSQVGSQNSDIGVATSTSMDVGTWTDHGSIGIPANNAYNKIDPNLFQHDANAPLYLTFGSYWHDVYQLEMQNPPLRVASSPQNKLYNSTAPSPTEGSYQFWWNVNGTPYYYLFFSSGLCCNAPPNLPPPGDEYKIMVCRANSPTGPFFDRNGRDCLTQNGGTLVLGSNAAYDVYAPGGQGVFVDPKLNSPVIYYHYIKPSVGYDYRQFQFGWNKLDFSSGWPVIVS